MLLGEILLPTWLVPSTPGLLKLGDVVFFWLCSRCLCSSRPCSPSPASSWSFSPFTRTPLAPGLASSSHWPESPRITSSLCGIRNPSGSDNYQVRLLSILDLAMNCYREPIEVHTSNTHLLKFKMMCGTIVVKLLHFNCTVRREAAKGIQSAAPLHPVGHFIWVVVATGILDNSFFRQSLFRCCKWPHCSLESLSDIMLVLLGGKKPSDYRSIKLTKGVRFLGEWGGSLQMS